MFMNLLVNVLQCICVSCKRLRISPWYVRAMMPLARYSTLKRLKAISVLCQRFVECTFCRAACLQFKQQGLGIIGRLKTQSQWTFVPPLAVFSALMQMPVFDLEVLGFPVGSVPNAHPVGCILSSLPVLPPVSRPAMRTVNLKTGQPFVVEGVRGVCRWPAGVSNHSTASRWNTRPSCRTSTR